MYRAHILRDRLELSWDTPAKQPERERHAEHDEPHGHEFPGVIIPISQGSFLPAGVEQQNESVVARELNERDSA